MEQGMTEVGVIGDELNGLGMVIKQVLDENLAEPRVRKSTTNLSGTLVVREKGTGISVSLFFNRGEIQIQNEAIDTPSTYLIAGFDELSELSSGQMGPIKALITGKIKAGGNLWKLLKMSKILIRNEER